ncbi:MAG: hypothetical protein R3C68_16400 [Myxococcota bacterium]
MPKQPRHRPLKRLEICPLCAGYMQPVAAIGGAQVGSRNWRDDTYHRSFGGNELRKFVCEKCHHEEIYQVDDLANIDEDD